MFLYFVALQFNKNDILLHRLGIVFFSGSASTQMDARISNGG